MTDFFCFIENFIKKRKKDFIIIACILLLALVFLLWNHYFFRNAGLAYCKILVDGDVVDTVELTKNGALSETFSVKERPNIVFEIRDASIAFIKSDCPDKVCIHTGYIRHNGQSASCLPNKTTIAIYSRDKDVDEPDIVVGSRRGSMDER